MMADSPIPAPVLRLLRHPDSNKVLSTVSKSGYPHSIVVGGFLVDDDGLIYVGEALMFCLTELLVLTP